MKKDFLCLTDWSLEDLEGIFDLTKKLKAQQKAGEKNRLLEGQTLGMLFEKSSTRTRVSFEVGMYQLGGHALFLSSSTTQMGRGEPIKDTARVMSRYVDGMVVRTFGQDVVEELARFATVPVINALTDLHHPCQVLSDIMTVVEQKGAIEQLKVAWVGDGNNMANSWIQAAARFGFELALACPEGYEPNQEILGAARSQASKPITVIRDPAQAVQGAEVINVDVWASMGQEEEQQERLRTFSAYQLNDALLARAPQTAIVLHCLPAHRGEEITNEVLEAHHEVIFDQAENKMHMHKAILETLLNPQA